MPNSTKTVTIATAGETISVTSPSVEYTDVYDEIFEVTNADTLQVIAEFDTTTIDPTKHLGYKHIILQNTGDAGLEVQIKHDTWEHSATAGAAGYKQFVLGKGEFWNISTDFIGWNTDVTSAANATTGTDRIIRGYEGSGVTIAEALDSSETEITVATNGGDVFRVGDYIALELLAAVTSDSGNNSYEVMKVTAINGTASIDLGKASNSSTPYDILSLKASPAKAPNWYILIPPTYSS